MTTGIIQAGNIGPGRAPTFQYGEVCIGRAAAEVVAAGASACAIRRVG